MIPPEVLNTRSSGLRHAHREYNLEDSLIIGRKCLKTANDFGMRLFGLRAVRSHMIHAADDEEHTLHLGFRYNVRKEIPQVFRS